MTNRSHKVGVVAQALSRYATQAGEYARRSKLLMSVRNMHNLNLVITRNDAHELEVMRAYGDDFAASCADQAI